MPLITDDLTPFFGVDEFAQTATVAGVPVPVMFDEASEVFGADGVVTREPTVVLKTSDAPSARPGDAVVVASVSYVVRQALLEPLDGKLLRLVLARS